MHWCTRLDEKPPCSQWGETENLRNMAALCCNASTLLRAALSLPLFIISRSKTPAMHCLWGKKCCVCVCVCECASAQEHYVHAFVRACMCYVCVCMCICVRLHGIHIKQFWRWLCFAGCHEYKRKHPSSWNTISQVVTVKLTLPSDCRHRERKTQRMEKVKIWEHRHRQTRLPDIFWFSAHC